MAKKTRRTRKDKAPANPVKSQKVTAPQAEIPHHPEMPAPGLLSADLRRLGRHRRIINVTAAVIILGAAMIVTWFATRPDDAPEQSGNSSSTSIPINTDSLLNNATACSAQPRQPGGTNPQSLASPPQTIEPSTLQQPEGINTASNDLSALQPAGCF